MLDMPIWLAFIVLIIGFIILIKGADIFVSGASNIAHFLGVSTLVIGLTVVAFGTSLPETAVSISAQIFGLDDVSLGNVIGSNIFNLLPILGISALIYPLIVKKDIIKRDLSVSIGATLLLILMFFFFSYHNKKAITRYEGIILISFLIIYLIYIVRKSLRETEALQEYNRLNNIPAEENVTTLSKKKAIIYTIIGLISVTGGGILVTEGAKEVALFFGMSEWLVGLTIVSLGTSLPELITSLTAAYKKEVDIAVGNVVGSNFFNLLFILGGAALIKPLTFNSAALFDLIFLAAASLIVLLLVLRKKTIGKLEGSIMILMSLGYFTYIIVREIAF